MTTTTTPTATLNRTKPVSTLLIEAKRSDGLRRSLGLVGITALGIGAIVGTGIFVLTGVAAAKYAGPGILLSFVLAAIVSGLSALCYAELASAVPVAGSAYTFTYATLGEMMAWIIGWDLILEYSVATAAVAIGWSSYVASFAHDAFGWTIPPALLHSPFDGGIVNLPAVLLPIAMTLLLVRGTAESSRFNVAVVAFKLAAVLFFIVVGATRVHPANWHPFLPFGWHGVVTGAGIIFFAYIGFDMISTAAEEARDPARDLPRGIIASLAICTVLYVAVSAILTGIVSYRSLNVASPVAFALAHEGLPWAAAIVSVGAIAGLTTIQLVNLFGQSRIFYAMSRDGLLPPIFSQVHPRFRTPYASSLLVGVVIAIVAGLTPIEVVAQLANIGTLTAFALVAIGVIILRRRAPHLERRFKVPFSPVLPALAVLGSLALMASLPPITWLRFVIWLAIGLGVYFAYGRKHSVLQSAETVERGTYS